MRTLIVILLLGLGIGCESSPFFPFSGPCFIQWNVKGFVPVDDLDENDDLEARLKANSCLLPLPEEIKDPDTKFRLDDKRVVVGGKTVLLRVMQVAPGEKAFEGVREGDPEDCKPEIKVRNGTAMRTNDDWRVKMDVKIENYCEDILEI